MEHNVMDYLFLRNIAFWVNINVYLFIVLGVFFLWVFWKRQRPELIDYLDSLNILTCCVGLFFEMYYLIEFWEVYTTAGEYAFPRWSLFLLRFLVLIGMLKKSLRRNFAYSFLLGAIISVEVFIILVTSLHADFLPSTLSVQGEQIQSFLIYGLIAFMVFLIRRNWSKAI